MSGVAIVFAGQLSAQTPGSLDPTFDGDGKVLTDIVNGGADRPSDVAVQSDGKIVVVGSSFAATSAFTLVRYETNGALDSNFGAGGKVTTSFGSGFAHAEAVAIQSDQKIVVVGRYLDGAASGFVIARYTTTGALDTNFNTTGYVMPDLGAGDEGAYDVAIQSADQKIVVVGGRWSGPPDGGMVAVRLTTTGALDPNFNGTGVKTVEMPVSWNAEIRVGINPVSGAITLGGHIQNEPFTWDAAVARLTATGTLDTTFNTTGTMSFPIGNQLGVSGFGLALQSNGAVLITSRTLPGGSLPPGGTYDVLLARVTAAGALDSGFGTGGLVSTDLGEGVNDTGCAVTVQGDGRILVAGISDFYYGIQPKLGVARFTSAGVLDATFGVGGVTLTHVPVQLEPMGDNRVGVALQSDGKLIVSTIGSDQSVAGGDPRFAVLRYATADAPEIAVEDSSGSSLVDGLATAGFGNVGISVTSAPKTLTIRNVGSATLSGLALTTNGTNAADFAISSLSVTSLPPGGSTTLSITCTPSGPGTRTAALHIASNDTDENPFDISFTATGVTPAPEIAIRDESANDLTDASSGYLMGAAVIGVGVTETLTISNIGSGDLSGLALSIEGADAAQFSVGSLGATSLAPSGSTTFTITFSPASAGSKSAIIHVTSNDADESPFDIVLRGGGLVSPLPALHAVRPTFPPGAATISETYNAPIPSVMAGGWLLFVASNGAGSATVWRSDGTAAGTQEVKPASPGVTVPTFSMMPGTSAPTFAASDGFAYFLADQSTDGMSSGGVTLWKSDGTASGTIVVKSGLFSDGIGSMKVVGSAVFFVASDGVNGTELWKSDGTTAGTVMIKDIRSGGPVPMNGSDPQQLTRVGNLIFFTADDGVNGRELWKSDGSSAGTVLVKDIRSGNQGSISADSLTFAPLTESGGTLFFTADNGTNGSELWKSDGTGIGTVMVKDINPGFLSGAGTTPMEGNSLTDVNGTLFFVASDATNGRELWKSDGTSAGTFMVKDIAPGTSSNPRNLAHFGGVIYMLASDQNGDAELWRSNGTSTGTYRVKDINSFSGSFPFPIAQVAGLSFIAAEGEFTGNELWMTDGTSVGTRLVSDLNPGSGGSSPAKALAIGRRLYFAAVDSGMDRTLHVLTPGPDIAIERVDPPGIIIEAGSTIDFGAFSIPSVTPATSLLIRNAGTSALSPAEPVTVGGDAGDFVIGAAGFASSLDPGSGNTITVTFAPTAPGTRTTTLRLSSNDPDQSPFDIVLTGAGGTGQEGWRFANFGTTVNFGDAADLADPDHDGIVNLMEWACALAPASASSLPTPLTNSGGALEFHYSRSTQAVNAGAVFVVEWSDSLNALDWHTTDVTQTILSDNGTLQQVKAALPAGSGERFVRLRVSVSP